MKTDGVRAKDIALTLLISCGLSVGLFTARVIATRSLHFWYMFWNLALAWLPMALAWWLHNRLRLRAWPAWKNILLTLLWLGFLPNSFYIITDFIHLEPSGQVSLLFDAVMLFSFAWNGLLLGFISVMIIHFELAKRVSKQATTILLSLVFLLCSFAIYLGRYLGWNTWDVIINPAGILFDLTDRIIRPSYFQNTFTTTALFFVTLSAMYYVIHRLFIVVLRIRARN